MFRNSPALKFAIPFAAGIAAGYRLPAPPACAAAAAVALLAAAFAFRRTRYAALLLAAAIGAAGWCGICSDAAIVPANRIDALVPAEKAGGRFDVEAWVVGSVTEEPHGAGRNLRFVVAADSVAGRHVRLHATGSLLVSARDSIARELREGEVVAVCGRLSPPEGPRNPGEPDLRQYFLVNNLALRMSADTIVRTHRRAGGFAFRAVAPVRRALARAIERLVAPGEAKFLRGLLLGERSEIDPATKSAFITAGVMHILAVSGLHVTILAGMIEVLFLLLRIPRRPRLVLASALIVYYGMLTGGAPSVTRSVVMSVVYFLGSLSDRGRNMWNLIGLSAIVILLADARALLQPGFQLSYGAIIPIVAWEGRLRGLLRTLPRRAARNPIVAKAWEGLSTAAAAGLGTLPLTAAAFGMVSFVGLFANIVAVPLSDAVLAGGMLATAVSYISGWLGSIFGEAAGLLTRLLIRIVALFAEAPYASATTHLSGLAAAAYYAAVAGAMAMIGATRRGAGLIAFLCGAAALAWLWATAPGPRLRVTVLDVGQGDAIVVEFPDGRNALIDGGPRTPGYDAGMSVVLPFLRRKGITQVDALILSHPHSDHLGGFPALARALHPRAVYEAGPPDGSALYREYRKVVDSLGIRRTRTHAGMSIDVSPGARCYIVGPEGGGGGVRNFNNRSVVVKMVYGTASIIFEGDAEHDEEGAMRARYGSFLRAGLLKTAHHGSITSSTPDFLDAVAPSAAIISVGAHNRFHHPSREVLARLASRRCRTLRTDRLGAVVFESDGRTWEESEWHP